MTSPQYSILYSARVDGAETAGSAGDVLIKSSTTGLYVKSTTANRGSRRSTGMALTSYVGGGTVEILQFGEIDATTANIGAGSASWVRVSTAGLLERASVSGSDDVCGWVEADGTFKACFGFLTAAMTAGGGGGSTPTGTGFRHVTAGVEDAASAKVNLAAAADVTGTLGAGNGGTGITSLAAGMSTWFGSGTSADLRSALTDPTGSAGRLVFSSSPTLVTPLILSSGGVNTYNFAVSNIAANRTITLPLLAAGDVFAFEAHTQTLTNKTINGANNTLTVRIANDVSGLGANVATFLGTPSGANLASALTSALPDTKGGTGLTALGANVATMLGTFSSANIKTACTDETGTGGALVFATSPTLTTPTLVQPAADRLTVNGVVNDNSTGTVNDLSLAATTGRIRFTNAGGITLNGLTGGAEGRRVRIHATATNIIVAHEAAGSTAANRFKLAVATNITLFQDTMMEFEYDATASRWIPTSATAHA